MEVFILQGKAKRDLPANIAEKLHALIALLESAENLQDIAAIWREKDINIVYQATNVIIAWEVSNHYE